MPTCFNKEHNNVLYSDNKDKMLYEDDDIECFLVGNPRGANKKDKQCCGK